MGFNHRPSLCQGIFPTQGLNPGLPHCRQTLYCLSHQGSPIHTKKADNIVLVNFLEDGSMSVTGIMGHAVQTVEIVNEGDHSVREKLMHLFMSGDCKAYSPEDLEKRKNSLKKWLEKNHIPITEQRDSRKTLCVAGVLTIDPPYGPENCNSSNEIILSRVQDLIQGHLEASQ